MKNYQEIQKEITFETSRSSGKGGQNVNKVESKVALVWDFEASIVLTAEEKVKIRLKAKSFLQNEKIRVVSQKSRSQLANKQDVFKKLEDLLEIWLKEEKPRISTKIPKSVKAKRLQDKKITSKIKKNRGKPKIED